MKSVFSRGSVWDNRCPVLYLHVTRFGLKVAQIGPKWDKSGGCSCCEIWCEKVCDLSHLCPIWPSLWPSLPLMLNESIQMKYRYSENTSATQIHTHKYARHNSMYPITIVIRQEQNSTYKCQHTSIGEMIQHIIWTQNKTILSYYTFFRLHKMKEVRTHYMHHQWKTNGKKNIFWWDIRMEALHIKPHLPTVLETLLNLLIFNLRIHFNEELVKEANVK